MFSIPDIILEWNPRVVAIREGMKGPTVPKWTEVTTRARDLQATGLPEGHDKYGIVLDSDTLVIDVDVHDGHSNGYASLDKLSNDLGFDFFEESAIVVASPSGGCHLYFSKDPGQELRKSVAEYPGLDFLTKGAQVIGPGSTHVSGGEYTVDGSWGSALLPTHHMAPRALSEQLKPVEVPQPAPRPPESPLDAFNGNREGVQVVKKLMEDSGYRIIAKGDDTYEFVRPGKKTSQHTISGTLGRKSKSGRFILRNFSTSDPLGFPSDSSITISEAYRILTKIEMRDLPRALSEEGFGGDVSDLSDDEYESIYKSMKKGSTTTGDELSKSCPTRNYEQLCEDAGDRRAYVIDGLLRRGELLNVVAPPKSGKSWLVYNIALKMAGGGDFLGFSIPRDMRCLLIDAELHDEELKWRIGTTSEALGIMPKDDLHFLCLRGLMVDIFKLEEMLTAANAGAFDVIVLDALYRFLPEGISENDNAQMMMIYSCLDRIARTFGVSVVVVHHTSKGHQGDKAATDIGSGAGSITRATDAQLILLPHETEGLYCVEAFTRSSRTPEPRTGQLVDGEWILSTEAPIRKGPKPDKDKDAGTLANQLNRQAKAKKVGDYLGGGGVLFVDKAEEIFGKGTTAGKYRGFMNHLADAGVIEKGQYGRHKPVDDWKEKLGQWISEGCPTKGEKTRQQL